MNKINKAFRLTFIIILSALTIAISNDVHKTYCTSKQQSLQHLAGIKDNQLKNVTIKHTDSTTTLTFRIGK